MEFSTFPKFSRPVFRVDLVPEFLAALRSIGLRDWALIREKLYTHFADQVMERLLVYKDAFVARESAEKGWYCLQKVYPLDDLSERTLALVGETKLRERIAYESLCQILSQPVEFTVQHDEDWSRL